MRSVGSTWTGWRSAPCHESIEPGDFDERLCGVSVSWMTVAGAPRGCSSAPSLRSPQSATTPGSTPAGFHRRLGSAGPPAAVPAWRHFPPRTSSPRRKPSRPIRSTSPSRCRLYDAKRQVSALPARALRQGEAGKSRREAPEGGPETSPCPSTEETPMLDRVLIVGAGPTGLTAALELSRLGIPVRIIDKQAAPPTTSRAVGVQARTLELLELRGLADEMVRLGNPGLAARFYGGGEGVFRLDFTRIDSRYHYLLFISQAETERILSTAVEKQGVQIERGVELVALAQDVLSHDPNPVRVVLRHADGRLEQAQAPWLLSAGGAHSIVPA